MKALHRKLLRDLSRMRGQAATIALVVACGVAVFVALRSTYDSLSHSKLTYYQQSRFADVFANVKRAPRSVVQTLAEVPDVASVEPRIVQDVTLDLAHLSEPAVGRLVSLSTRGDAQLSRVHVRAGRAPDPARTDEVVISEAFAKANRLGPGDAIDGILNGRKQSLRVVGVGLSPEYIFAIRDFLPDDEHFGILWMHERALAAAFDMDGAFNDVAIALTPGASPETVIAHVDEILKPYGGFGAYARKDQPSDFYITQEIAQLEAQAQTVPAIFLGIAAFLLNVVMSRVITTQREQIAALKALGYGNLAVALHYLSFVLLIVLGGTLAGAALGAWLGRELTELYAVSFRFPVLAFRVEPSLPVISGMVTLVAAAVGGMKAVWSAVRLAPAEAMRPPAPPKYRPGLLERLGVTRLLSPQRRMVFRNLRRRPIRAALSTIGVAFAVGMVVVGAFFEDAIDFIMDAQFRLAQRDDATVSFTAPLRDRAIRELEHLPGVERAEGFRAVPVRASSGHRSRRLAVLGIEPDADLRLLMATDLSVTRVPEDGVVLTKQLGKALRVDTGDSLTLEILEGKRRTVEVVVAAMVDEMIGLNVYMDIDALGRLIGEENTVSGAMLAVDDRYSQAVYSRLKSTPAVAGVVLGDFAIRQFEEGSASYMLVFTTIITAFASVIAVGVVYNSARISLAERSRELASLRVMGFTTREISSILLSELFVIVAAAIPIGCVIGYVLASGMMTLVDPEVFRIPIVISAKTYGFAAGVVVVAAAASAALVRRRLNHLDLISVLKTKE